MWKRMRTNHLKSRNKVNYQTENPVVCLCPRVFVWICCGVCLPGYKCQKHQHNKLSNGRYYSRRYTILQYRLSNKQTQSYMRLLRAAYYNKQVPIFWCRRTYTNEIDSLFLFILFLCVVSTYRLHRIVCLVFGVSAFKWFKF